MLKEYLLVCIQNLKNFAEDLCLLWVDVDCCMHLRFAGCEHIQWNLFDFLLHDSVFHIMEHVQVYFVLLSVW